MNSSRRFRAVEAAFSTLRSSGSDLPDIFAKRDQCFNTHRCKVLLTSGHPAPPMFDSDLGMETYLLKEASRNREDIRHCRPT
jgi:hypothetical protein